ncbi:hypothetical protein NEOLI_004298, partial [Neolecta irregularis DAH-3]
LGSFAGGGGYPSAVAVGVPGTPTIYGRCYKVIAILLDGCEPVQSYKPVISSNSYWNRQVRIRVSLERLMIEELALQAGSSSPKNWAEEVLVKKVRPYSVPFPFKHMRPPGIVDWSVISKASPQHIKTPVKCKIKQISTVQSDNMRKNI